MKNPHFFPARFAVLACMLSTALAAPTLVQAQAWKVQIGFQTEDKGTQLLAYLPNEIWIHSGDSILFTMATDEPHTVTFLTPGQVRLPYAVGCPGTAPSGADARWIEVRK